MKKILLIYAFTLFAAILPAQNKNVLRIDLSDSVGGQMALDRFWRFHNGDDTAWASPTFDDSKWDTAITKLPFSKNDSNIFKGIAWFRIHIYIDSSLDKEYIAILVNQVG